MTHKLQRRNFLGKFTAAVIGSVTLGSCISGKKEGISQTVENPVLTTSQNSISKNREMPRELVMKILDQKVDQYMQISFNCAQSSFLALKEQFGLQGAGVLKALTPLTGIAERGETCGAVIGSLMCFGLIYGRGKNRLNDWETYRQSLVPSGEFCNRFEKEYGSTMCCNIQKQKFGKCFHLTNPEELKCFQEAGATSICSSVVRKAVRITAEIILDGPKTVHS
ncbi:MAG: C_GCAxxG_C_C family protein [Chlorobi bacterium]|nr:C_GCAxxG_C_C family protein [Chlorobiota bacterium]